MIASYRCGQLIALLEKPTEPILTVEFAHFDFKRLEVVVVAAPDFVVRDFGAFEICWGRSVC